jgi:hypothetical protein
MARNTGGYIGVESARLPLENRQVVCVADDAVLRFDALQRRVAGGAIVSEKSVRLRQFPRSDRTLR